MFSSSPAIGKINISTETIAALSDFGKTETQHHVFCTVMNTEKLHCEKKKPQSDL